MSLLKSGFYPLLTFYKEEELSEFESKLFSFLEPLVDKAGYELVDVTFKKEYGTDTLTVYIWKKGGVSLDDCETIHNIVDPALDEFNPTGENPYNLNVSSPGLDRPIVTKRDYERNVDEEIEVYYKSPVAGKKKITGVLLSTDEEKIVLNTEKGDVVVNKDIIASAKPLIKF